MTNERTVYDDIRVERDRQDAQWGGGSHDDEHAPGEWRGYRTKFEDRIRDAQYVNPEPRYRIRRDALVKLAALAVARGEG